MNNWLSQFLEKYNLKTIYLLPALIVVIILIASTIGGSFDKTVNNLGEAMGRKTVISQQELEKKYGIRINFLGVAPMMGSGEAIIDLELQILDFNKAKVLIGDPKKPPQLVLSKPNAMPLLPERSTASSMMYEFMFPNMGNVVQPGDILRVNFGNLQVEPIKAK